MEQTESNEEIVNRLSMYFKAFYPVINIMSFEEDRVEWYLEKICSNLELNFFLWDIIDGFKKIDQQEESIVQSGSMDYADYYNALTFIEQEGYEKSLFFMKDFHPAFSLESSDQIVRKVRNVIANIRDSMKIMVFLIPPNCRKTAIPPEMEKETVVYNFPLPELKEAKGLLNQVVSESLQGQIPEEFSDEKEKETLVKAGLGLTTSELENVFMRSAIAHNRFSLKNIEMILEEKKQIIEKTGILQYFSTDVDKTEIGGLDRLKEWLEENRKMFDEEAVSAGCDIPKGILLFGVPGCGKSLTAKAMASQWNMPLLRLDLGAVFGGLVGESESNMNRALEAAESIAPCVLWVDEIEKGLAGMSSSGSSDSGTSQRVFGNLISWMQDRSSPVFFAATANDISKISANAPELLRSGRFDEIFFVDLPNHQERQEIFRIHLTKRKETAETFDLEELSRLSKGFSGSDIEQVIKDAKRQSYVAGISLSQENLQQAVSDRLPVAVTMKDKIEELRNWASIRARFSSKEENLEEIESMEEYQQRHPRRRRISL